MWLRHQLYDHHLLPSSRSEVPTVCVGNLAVGGTGKTPMTAYITELLLSNGYHPAILSRGYKRASHGFVLADGESTAATIGDEAMQLHATFPSVPVAVCEHRVQGIKLLQRHVPETDVVVLDDGMQHRALRSGMTVLLTSYDRLYIDDHLLPWGRLRDLPSRALEAEAVVVTKCPDTIRPIDMRAIDNRLHLPTYQQLHFSGIDYVPVPEEGTPLVVCGIANPKELLEYAEATYPHAKVMTFPDHHRFKKKEVRGIAEQARSYDFVLTTEKDMQRLRLTELEAMLEEEGKRLVSLPIRARFLTPHEAFDKQILTYVQSQIK